LAKTVKIHSSHNFFIHHKNVYLYRLLIALRPLIKTLQNSMLIFKGTDDLKIYDMTASSLGTLYL